MTQPAPPRTARLRMPVITRIGVVLAAAAPVLVIGWQADRLYVQVVYAIMGLAFGETLGGVVVGGALALAVVPPVLIVALSTGRGWARIAYAALVVVGAAAQSALDAGLLFVYLPAAVAIVLLCLPASNAWYEKRADARQ